MGKELSLLDHCTEEATTIIICGSCQKENVVELEILEAIDAFFEQGWRVRKSVCYCTECSKENGLIK